MDALPRRSAATTELIGLLAHELRNPLASLQGCAQTLLDRGDGLSADTRERLAQVIVGQSQHLDWVIGALAALGGVPQHGVIGVVDVAAAAAHAAERAGGSLDFESSAPFLADERRVRLALEALFLAMWSGGATGSSRLGDVLEIFSTAQDLDRGGRRWKLDLARRLLREEGCQLRVRRSQDGTQVTVRFPVRDGQRRRIA